MSQFDQNEGREATSMFDQYLQETNPVPVEPIDEDSVLSDGDDLPYDELQAELHDEILNASATDSEKADEPGSMPAEVSRAMRQLLNTGVIRAEKKKNVFEVICLHESIIRTHLSNMLLKVVIDKKAGIAILLEQELSESEADEMTDEEGSSLVNKRTLPLYESLVLLVLRKYYQDREITGENKVMIDVELIAELMNPFLKLTNSSALDRKSLNGAIKKLQDKRLLAIVRGTNRLEITPVIRYVVNADFLSKMLSEFQRLADEGVQAQQVEEDE